ncbi:MAG: CCA tRNA nucleotidyltransferase [Pirellulales bacterium]|nr:CCA tRNA nucleotidyltransferase [Pirellulales bacterium]
MAAIEPLAQRQFALDVVRTLRDRGHLAYWAGGCVRDQLLGLLPKDYDVATDATPQLIREIFGRRRTLFVGAAFGVVTVVGPKRAGHVEVTTFRSDAAYSDGRHPDSIAFSTPEVDAQRRDFTINGLFYDPLHETVIDYVGGQADLHTGIIRAIGEPRARFEEDKLRMIRAVRFTARFDFRLDPATFEAVRQMAPQLKVVSIERVMQELKAILTGPHRRRAVELLDDTGLLAQILPEVAKLAPSAQPAGASDRSDSAWSRMLALLELLEQPSFSQSLAVLLAETSPETVAAVCQRLRTSTKEQERAVWLVRHRGALAGAAERPWSEIQPVLVAPGGRELLDVYDAELQIAGRDRADWEYCRQKLELPPEVLDPPPLLTGDHLIAKGVPRGKVYKLLLDRARTAQLDGQTNSEADALQSIDRWLAELDPPKT